MPLLSPPYLAPLPNTSQVFQTKKTRSEHGIFNLSLKNSHPPVASDNETQRQTGNDDGDTCVYTITHSV